MSLGNLGTLSGRKGADKEQCRDSLSLTHTHTHTLEKRKKTEEISKLERKKQILWRRAVINLAT